MDANVEFNIGDKVYDKEHGCYATVLNNYGDPCNGDCGDIRLDTDGNVSIFKYDKKWKRIAYNLIKL